MLLSELGELFRCGLITKYSDRRIAWNKFYEDCNERDNCPNDE